MPNEDVVTHLSYIDSNLSTSTKSSFSPTEIHMIIFTTFPSTLICDAAGVNK